MKSGYKAAAWLIFVVLPVGIILYKIFVLHFSLDHVVPWKGYTVRLEMTFDAHGDSVEVETYLPLPDKRQHTWDEVVHAEPLLKRMATDSAGNRILHLSAASLSGAQHIQAEYNVLGEQTRYEIEKGLLYSSAPPPETKTFLDSTAMIPTGHHELKEVLHRIEPESKYVLPLLKAIFSFAADSIRYRNFTGSTEALTALRLGEASCNGKSRLMVALLRSKGIPARLVGGLILDKGVKRTSHQWLEAYVSGFWIPFCPTNHHFAEIPNTYLALYRGDEVLFKRSANLNFNYSFTMEPMLITKDEIGLGQEQLGSIMRVWEVFNRIGLNLKILKVLLLVPIGGFITVIFRNILGLEPFGTFLPSLIASAAHETGLFWGITAFFLVIAICAALRGLLEGFKLTHTPKLAIIMIFVVASMLGLTYLGLTMNMHRLVYVSLFPLVVMTMTVERFSRTVVEDGLAAALRRSVVTGVAILCCYAVMSLKVLPLILMTFPEALLLLAGLNMWVGRWAGIRVTEYWRFRHFLFGKTGTTVP